ncbi:divalent-cation tolerance protein CutA [Methanohalophilus mahii]|uniref:CutA1 divalent ion tolerance protein n=1 Tax=Methanohalophilus mahii (strain ATCC 35705 / DSM 5219 / SLP) TaxID=547558 RepID=D5E7H0_METMS|nr:divalent-cation tolerance protein CutA [Methanohalophilus mahii]ADE37108.1 CutA1 divalent ion tolerance protein [Methanohalophilus mahii DSM 5219]
MEFIIVYITTSDTVEARNIASELVSQGLVACVNMYPIRSVFMWEGEVNEDDEVVLFAKTTKNNFEPIRKLVRSIHSYELPAIVSWNIEGDSEFLEWISTSVSH